MIQMSEAFASGSSSSSRLAHSVGMTPSYVEGYLRKISCEPHHISESFCLAKRKEKEKGTDFHDHHRLLNDIANPGIDQVHEHVDATFRRRLNLDRTLSDRLDASPHELNIDFRGVPSSSRQSLSLHTIEVRKYILLQFTQQRIDVALPGKTDHDIQLLNLDIGRVIILTKEHTHLILEDVRALLQQKVNVSQGDPLDFWCRGDEGDEWGRHLADELFH